MKAIGKKSCFVFRIMSEHLHSKFAKSANMTPKISLKNNLHGKRSTLFKVDSK
jgi:hypothetical protein